MKKQAALTEVVKRWLKSISCLPKRQAIVAVEKLGQAKGVEEEFIEYLFFCWSFYKYKHRPSGQVNWANELMFENAEFIEALIDSQWDQLSGRDFTEISSTIFCRIGFIHDRMKVPNSKESEAEYKSMISALEKILSRGL